MKEPIRIMINGIPGNVAVNLARHALADNRFLVIPWSLTGPEIEADRHEIDAFVCHLIRPAERDERIQEIRKQYERFISIDYTHPSAINANAEFYCRYHLPFVMGTTGGNRQLLLQTVQQSGIPAVIAPNMAKQIVGFQAMMAYAAETFPGLFKGYSLEIRESHQQGKADTSGTAKAMVEYFNKLGVPFSADDILMERDPVKQARDWGIPEAYLSGHGWHTYTLVSADKNATFTFTHNINGRDIYVDGTLDAVVFLHRQMETGIAGKVFSMIDVMRGFPA
ncbi:MAG: dihydrodipicolinate reductase [Thermodesulfobacteriota bacterium]